MATITVLASHYESAAGSHPTISSFDELWGYTSERSNRMWHEMVPVPTRQISCRFVTTHAGFEGESLLLKSLYDRGMALPEVAPGLHAGDGLLLFWSHAQIARWCDDKWIASSRRTLPANQFARMIENRWVTSESSFIEMSQWDRCVDVNARPVPADRTLSVWCAVDASTKRDATALAAFSYNTANKQIPLVNHKIFTPTSDRPIDFESMVERTLLDWSRRYRVKAILYDPYQMVSVAQRLAREGLPMVEFPQTAGNLTEMSSNLADLVAARNLVVYPCEEIRVAVARAVAIESVRGWKITKEKAAHRIDVVVAMAMAALATIQAHATPRRRVLMTTYGTGNPLNHPTYEVGAGGRLIPIEEEPRQRIRFVRLSEQEAPAVRGRVHSKFGY